MSRIAGNLLLALASTLLTLAVLEGTFRLLGDAPLASGWRSLCPTAQMNEFGYRGRRASYSDDDYVIVLLGDSQLEACGLPDDQMPEILLEKSLGALGRKTRVIGLGASGYGQDQQLLALEEYLQKYRADLVVVWLTPGNDIWNNTFRTHTVSRTDGPPKPTFWLENHALNGPTERIGERTSSLYLLQLLRNAFGGFEAAWSRRLPPADKGVAAIPPELAATTAATQEAVETQQSHWSMFLTPTPPRVQYGIELTRTLLTRIQNAAARHGARFATMAEDRTTAAARAGWTGGANPFFEPPQPKAVERERRYWIADLEAYIGNVGETTKGFPFFLVPIRIVDHHKEGDSHLNVAGNTQIMTDFAARLVESGFVDRQTDG